MAEVGPEFNEMPASKPNWQTKLDLLKKNTASGYKPHIENFIKARGNHEKFVQADIDSYFAELKKADDRKP